MRSRYIFKKNCIFLLIILMIGIAIDIPLMTYFVCVKGLDNVDELELIEFYAIAAMLPVCFVGGWLALGSEYLKVDETSVTKCKWFKKVRQINWPDVISVERKVIRNGISKTEKPTMTEVFTVLKLCDNSELTFMFSNKSFDVLKTYFENTRKTDKI